MKKMLLICGLIIAAASANAAEVELKLGLDLYRDVTKDAFGDGPTGEYPGGSVGLELLFNEDSPFRYGLGLEAKNQIEAKNDYDAHYMFPIYAVGKYDFAETWYGVGRAGYAIASDDADGVSEGNGGFYGALGIGKEFWDERVNVELMYEFAEYDYDRKSSLGGGNEDGNYHGIALKFAYKFGGQSPAPAMAPAPAETAALAPIVIPAPEPIPVVAEIIPAATPAVPMDVNFRESFATNGSDLSEKGLDEINEVVATLSGFEGTIVVEGHTDDTGSEAYNQQLSEKRAEVVAAKFRELLDGENIEIISKGHGETKPHVANDSPENRELNRRVEMSWTPVELMEEADNEMDMKEDVNPMEEMDDAQDQMEEIIEAVEEA